MATSTLNIPLPEDLKDYVEARVDSGDYGTPTDYVGDLIRRERESNNRLEDHLIEAMKGPFVEITDREWEHGDIMAIAEERFDQSI